MVLIYGTTSLIFVKVAESLFNCGLLEGLLEVSDSSPINHMSVNCPNKVPRRLTPPTPQGYRSLCGLELCCMATQGEAVTGATLAVAEMLLQLFCQDYQKVASCKKSAAVEKESSDSPSGQSISNSRGHRASKTERSASRKRSGKLRIGDTVIAAGTVSQVCLLSSSLCWSRVSNKDKRRGVIIADHSDGTFLVRA